MRLAAAAAFLLLTGLPMARAQTVLTLAANGSQSVDPDRMVAALDVQFSAADAARAQAEVNHAMAQALSASKAVAGVMATTGDYSVYQTTPDGASPGGSQKTMYQASQNLQLGMAAPMGDPPAAFTALVGRLQQNGLLLNSLSGDLSAKAQESAQQGAIDDAIRQIQAQAQTVAATLNEHVGKIQSLSINVDMPGPVMRVAPMMMAAAAAPPQAAPAQVTIQASVSAVIGLNPP